MHLGKQRLVSSLHNPDERYCKDWREGLPRESQTKETDKKPSLKAEAEGLQGQAALLPQPGRAGHGANDYDHRRSLLHAAHII